MVFAGAVVERAMKLQEIILRALSGSLTWLQAADILDLDPRTVRRWRARFEANGALGLYDRRRQPSRRHAPALEVKRILQLYRETYRGFNVRHFHHIARREHGVTLSYSFVKLALQEAGLVPRRRARGRHRRRREPRACYGELLAIDGSSHGWLFLTPKAGGKVDREQLTQVGRALARLGIEHIPSYSPQARGRVERLNRTLQDRLVNELRVAEITTVAGANAYLRERFIPDYNATFTRAPRDPASAFVALGTADLEQILCEEEPRTVGQDNVVAFDGIQLQLAKQPGRATCAGLTVTVRRHLSGQHSVWRGPQCLGHYDARGHAVALGGTARRPLPDGRPLRRGALRVTRRRLGGDTV